MADEIRSRPLSIVDRAADVLKGLGMDGREAQRLANKAQPMLLAAPGTGDYAAAQDFLVDPNVLSGLAAIPVLGGGIRELAVLAKIARAKELRATYESLRARGAADLEYRDMLSTGSKKQLARGDTWQKNAERLVQFFEKAE